MNEGRRILKKLQGIVFNRADADAQKVLDELEAFIQSERPKPRAETGGFDRLERRGRTRKTTDTSEGQETTDA